MNSSEGHIHTPEKDEFLFALEIASMITVPMALKAATETGILETLAGCGPTTRLSSRKIASTLSIENEEAPVMIDRVLRLLASFGILSCDLVEDKDDGGRTERLYGLGPKGKYFVDDGHGGSLAPMLLLMYDKVRIDGWFHLKDAIAKGEFPSTTAHGTSFFEHAAMDGETNEIFNVAMKSRTNLMMREVLEKYDGFEDVHELVDVGGGVGSTLRLILMKYPNIKGINFDLPHVIKDAPPFKGMMHVAGDMFEGVPKAQVVFMKWVLHNWSDDLCLKLLRNCWKALPESGKLVIIDTLLPERPETDILSRNIFISDVVMLNYFPGGKERTRKEFEILASRAGFRGPEIACRVHNQWVFEFHKKI